MTGILYVPFIGYLEIAADAHVRMVTLSQQDTEDTAERVRFQDSAAGQATIVVTFCAIALESFIHNYAARKLGEGFASVHIDKMSLQTKWLLVPQLVTGNAIPPDYVGVQLLRKLVSARNSVVHLKAKTLQPEYLRDSVQQIRTANRSILEAAVRAFECIGLLGQALAERDADDAPTKLLAGFASSAKYRIVSGG